MQFYVYFFTGKMRLIKNCLEFQSKRIDFFKKHYHTKPWLEKIYQ